MLLHFGCFMASTLSWPLSFWWLICQLQAMRWVTGDKWLDAASVEWFIQHNCHMNDAYSFCYVTQFNWINKSACCCCARCLCTLIYSFYTALAMHTLETRWSSINAANDEWYLCAGLYSCSIKATHALLTVPLVTLTFLALIQHQLSAPSSLLNCPCDNTLSRLIISNICGI